ncbi:unnamed protein product [Timema podura]|uniref:Uncharacterized protein n=1 Tax=Timema podura TaxID=61482 RepID=A0ABN7NY32_TIMPD|nr:unnamed protein product [Timema podura]
MRLREILANTTFHVLNQLVLKESSVLARVMWLIVWLTSLSCGVTIVMSQWFNFRSNPTLVSVEITSGSFDFPSISVSYEVNIDMNIIKDVISKENLSWLPERMHKGLPRVYSDIANRAAARRPVIIKESPEYFEYDMDYAGIMNKVADHYLVESSVIALARSQTSYEGDPFDCCSVFEKVYGHYGPLFTFNSLISHSTNITGKLKFDLKTNSYKSPPALKYQINPNKMALGLKFRLKQQAFVSVTHPMAIWERTKARNLFTKYNYELYVNDVVEVRSSEEIPNIPVERRDCVFQGELPLVYHGLYHPTVCVEEMERAKEMEKCGCTVYNYPPDGNGLLVNVA